MPGLKDLPRGLFGDGFGVTAADLAANFSLPMTSIAQGSIVPDKIGLPFTNKTGGTLTAGTLVYQNGWDTATSRPTMAKASASAFATTAAWVVLADVLNNASGTVGQHFALTGQNTNAATVGDPVYLNTTAGGFTITNPPASPVVYQQVGTVAVKSATVGVVEFRLMAQPIPQALERPQSFFPTIATTATTESAPIIMPRAGSVVGFQLSFLTARALDGTNFVTFTVNNRTQTKLLTSAVVGNSTFTGGQAVTQYGPYTLTVTATAGDLVVAALDKITCLATITGTLPGALGPGTFSLVYAPN